MSSPAPTFADRVVILGGGFGSVYTAFHLLRQLKKSSRRDMEVTLVNRENFFLMTPLLFEAGSGILEPRHVVTPIRRLLPDSQFVQADVESIDFDKKVVRAKPAADEAFDIPYHHLVIGLGGITNTHIIPGANRALTFKSLADAIYLRNHVIDIFERADVERDVARKQALLTFVIAGAGLVGVELCGELTEFLANIVRSYPNVRESDIRVELLEAGPNVMPEMDRSLADYAVRTLQKRNVSVRSNSPAKQIEADKIHLAHETINSHTIIVATGVSPAPVLASFPLQKDPKGRLLVDATMRSKDRPEVWAIGDCADIPNPDGKPYPQLAQHALREAKILAYNLLAAKDNRPLKPFVYETIGTLAALGHYNGVGRIGKIKIRGFIAWWVWRSYYLMQMPGWERRIRIVIDWTVALFFKNDIVKLDLFGQTHSRHQPDPPSVKEETVPPTQATNDSV